MSSSSDLPGDLVIRIMCRLPVKSLMWFNCVSKRWLSIISDPKFRKSHFQVASKLEIVNRKVFIVYPFLRKPGVIEPEVILPPLFQSLDDKFSVKKFEFPSEELKDMGLIGSCNGLLLLGKGQYETLSLWNISTGSYREISAPCLRSTSMPTNVVFLDSRCFLNVGFGHVSSSDDYKFVIVHGLGDLFNVHIFSLRANCWRVITAPYSSWPGWDSGEGTFSDGAIIWVIGYRYVMATGYRNETGLVPSIYAFDLAKEEFRKMALPPILWQNEQGGSSIRVSTVVHLGGHLCVLSQTGFCPRECDIWAMTEYGVPSSWVNSSNFIHKISCMKTSPHGVCASLQKAV